MCITQPLKEPQRARSDQKGGNFLPLEQSVDLHCLVFDKMKSSGAKVNPDIAREREKASFNPTELTYLLYGGREKTERKRYLGELELYKTYVKE